MLIQVAFFHTPAIDRLAAPWYEGLAAWEEQHDAGRSSTPGKSIGNYQWHGSRGRVAVFSHAGEYKRGGVCTWLSSLAAEITAATTCNSESVCHICTVLNSLKQHLHILEHLCFTGLKGEINSVTQKQLHASFRD